VSVLDWFLVFSFHRLVDHQQVIIKATQKTEEFIKQTSFQDFVPKFSENKVKAQNLLVLALYTSVFGLFAYSAAKLNGLLP
jgi:hypothetical protein